MDSFEINKAAMAILVAGVTAMSISMVVNSFYVGSGKEDAHHGEKKRGYQVEVTEEAPANAGAGEQKSPDIAAFFANASLDKGVNLAKACAACHDFTQGGAHKVGPRLYEIVGADIARHADYSYSNGLSAKEGVWDYQALSEFLEKPRNYVEGTKMAYAGMKKPEDRASILLYLQSLSGSPVPLPEVKAVEAVTEVTPEVAPTDKVADEVTSEKKEESAPDSKEKTK